MNRFSFPHETASMFAFEAVAQIHSLPFFSPNNRPPNVQEILPILDDQDQHAQAPVILLGPGRKYSISHEVRRALERADVLLLKLCQLRNPLDIIVSQYFSHG